MELHKQSNGLLTFLEHWGLLLIILGALLITQAATFFSHLNGQPWINFFTAGMVLLITGALLILRAKIPAYRSGRFLTFGLKSVPAPLAGHYRWGWRLFSLGVLLSLCLLLSTR
jgi:hypothetical protein